MPGGNRTGPAGAGPLTGRGRGLCKGFDAPDAVNRPRGGGQGRRRWTPGAGPSQKQPLGGFGAGYGPRESSASDQLEVLKAQAGYLEKSLDGIKRRIKELETAGDQ